MLHISLQKLFTELEFTDSSKFKNVYLSDFEIDQNRVWQIKLRSQELIDIDSLIALITHIKMSAKIVANITCEIMTPIYVEKTVLPAFKYLVEEVNFLISKNIKYTLNNKTLVVSLSIYEEYNYLNSHYELLLSKMKQFGFYDLEINFQVPNDNEKLDLSVYKPKIIDVVPVSSDSLQASQAKIYSRVGYIETKLNQLEVIGNSKVIVKGEIFKVDHMETKTGLVIVTISITDSEEAISIKFFARKPNQKREYKTFKVGMYVKATGTYSSYDSYARGPIISGTNILKIDSPNISIDNETEKRCELALHTKMSAMDGISSAAEYLEKAIEWKHDAIAIIDDNSVQAFPEFYKLHQDHKIKKIYGSTINTIAKNVNAITNPSDQQKLNDEEFVVLDIETTGLSPIFNEIIEFGAVKIRAGELREHGEIQFFIKPSKPITEETTALTGIKNDHFIEGAYSEVDGLKKMVEYIGSCTIVAHNSNFDISFINEKLERNNMPLLTNPVIDSLVIARYINSKGKRFSLKNVAHYYLVEYDDSGAHRADYDARLLGLIWLKMLPDLNEKGITTHSELFNISDSKLYEKSFSKTVTILAKNQKGLKELFKIISKVNTVNYFKGPKFFIEEFTDNKSDNILLGSGGLTSRLVDLMFFGTNKQLINEVKRYDYIEVQPLQNFRHIVSESITIENIKDAIRNIISIAKSMSKLIVASGDVRYLDDRDKIAHQIIIESKGLEGRRHYLFRYKKANAIYPVQTFLNTADMLKQFSFLNDKDLVHEIVVKNSRQIAASISRVEITKKGLFTPKLKDASVKLRKIVYDEAYSKYGKTLSKYITDRIERELAPIIKYGYAVIYVISHLLVAKSLRDGYLVGSRGSVGSSFVATLAKITDVNPLDPHYYCDKCKHFEVIYDAKYNSGFDLPGKECPNCRIPLGQDGQKIPFEVFLGFEGDKVPDIDLNFSSDYQAIIHEEVRKIFGDSHCFRAGTISTMAERTAYGYVKGWCEEKGHEYSPSFIDYLASKLIGIKRTTGQHPGGIIVIPNEYSVEEFTPINYPANDVNSAWKTTHFDFHAIHDNVLKFDLLGHDDPTIIRQLEELTGVKSNSISMQDERIISIFSSPEVLGIKKNQIKGLTTGVLGIPEFGTVFVRSMLKATKVKSFADIVSISGLAHGTGVWAGNADVYLKDAKLNLELPDLITCRDSIMSNLVEKGLSNSDAFRIMEQVRKGNSITPDQEKLLNKHKISPWYIESLKKIKYLFPKAHATAYVIMAWKIAWYKIEKMFAYYATYFSMRVDSFDLKTIAQGSQAIIDEIARLKEKAKKENLTTKEKAVQFSSLTVLEALTRGVKIQNIDVNKSHSTKWLIIKGDTLIPPFNAVDGIGDSVANALVKARSEKTFTSVEDFKKRGRVNASTMTLLKEIGVFNDLQSLNQIAFNLDFKGV